MKSKVAKILPSESDSSIAGAVILGDGGPTLPADFVIMGVGVAPATGFLKESGFTLERDGGVRVDEFMRVVGLDGSVYAIGSLRRCFYLRIRPNALQAILLPSRRQNPKLLEESSIGMSVNSHNCSWVVPNT